MDGRVSEWTADFVEKIRTTEEYIFYKDQVALIQNYPELITQINQYRAENFELQNRYEGDELFDKLEEFTQKYETLLENPVANDFLQAEAGLVKMMQEINISLVEGLNFQ